MLTQRAGASRGAGVVEASATAALTAMLAHVGRQPAAALLKTSRLRTVLPGEVLIHEEQRDHACVLIDGMLRTAVSLPDGRAATIHYVRPVGFAGLPTIFYPVPLTVFAVRGSTVIELDATTIRQCAREYPEFGWFLSLQLARAVLRVPAIIEEFGFKTVRQRVAAHLMELSESDATTGVVTARVTQMALAEYVGSAREVVSRCMRSLADEGAVLVGHGSVRILDEAVLRAASGGALGTPSLAAFMTSRDAAP